VAMVSGAAGVVLEAWFRHRHEQVQPRPLLDGWDLVAALGLEPGPIVGRLLEELREAQACGEVSDRGGALAFVRRAAGRQRRQPENLG
jgi:hypothetical protein